MVLLVVILWPSRKNGITEFSRTERQSRAAIAFCIPKISLTHGYCTGKFEGYKLLDFISRNSEPIILGELSQ